MATEPAKTFTLDEVKSMIAETTKETTKAIFEQFAPLMQSMALTPDKLREANKPWEDPAALARKNHEQENWRRQETDKTAAFKQRQTQCTHKDRNGLYAISLQHNFHDNMPRGICLKCELYIHPTYWDYRPVTAKDGTITEKALVVPAHPLYHIVQEIEHAQ